MKRKKLFLVALLLLVAGALVVFIGVNVADYCRYRYIMNLDKHLTPEAFKEIAETVASSKQSADYSEANMPAIFKKIGAKNLTIYRAKYRDRDDEIIADATLYERGKPVPKNGDWRINYTYATLYVQITRQNQEISLQDNFSGRPASRTLWLADPALEEQTNPRQRILTLYDAGIRLSHTWIVTKDAIIYSSDTTTEKQPLTIFQSDAIGGGIDMIPPQIYGKRFYDKNLIDGLTMGIVFSQKDGEPVKEIEVNNSWCPELEPLLTMLKEFAPHGDEIPTKSKMMRVREFEGYGDPSAKYVGDDQVQSIEEYRAYPPLKTDWWIVWPKLFLEKPKVALETPPEYR